MCTLCFCTLFLILSHSCTVCLSSFNFHTERSHVYTRVQDDTACTGRNTHRQSHAFDVWVARTVLNHRKIWYSLFFFFSIITFASPSRTTFQERQTHGIPYFFNRYTFVSETSSVTNRCITLSLYPSLTSGPCVQFILLHRTEYSVSFSLTSLVMFCFSSICTISSALDRLDV